MVLRKRFSGAGATAGEKEKSIVAKIKNHLEAIGFFVVKLHGSHFQRAGLPDLLALRDGQTVFFEVKRPGEKPTKLQKHVLDELVARGFVACVVRSVADVEMVLEMESVSVS